MGAHAVFTGIVLGVTGLSLVPLGDYFFPAPYKANTIVRVASGLSQPHKHDEASTGGDMPSIALFDGNGERIGFKSGSRHGKIPDGRYEDISITPIDRKNNRPAEYISLSASSPDALCVAYIAVTHPSKEYWAFTGDNAAMCGVPWYHSNLVMQVGDLAHKPKCFWIDGPDDDGKTTYNFPQGIGIHLIDFIGSEALYAQYADHPDSMCKSAPRLKMYKKLNELQCLPVFNPPLEYTRDGLDADLEALKTEGEVMCSPPPGQLPTLEERIKLQRVLRFPARLWRPTYGVKKKRDKIMQLDEREEQFKPTCFNNDIVISNSMSAKELCDDPGSRGPDFVSKKEGFYCDMCTHTLWPVCHKGAAVQRPLGCFDIDAKKLHYDREKTARDNSTIVPVKNYQNVRIWK
ncbi:uncharacterized protein CIMG_10284 [Coccidioides immitis RS]|uniref:Uncharacterized protein n=2 Tax=Coccidioides immitis TaxID=5501 RepID=A0A0E1RUI3_COCIM|nr:uncharacterized protein CIMG_10284 [Coccidioides immitis RS]EAS27679.1 hypothetical protein CIMG_10284 [Coccidioides immitis RS]KMU81404.1 hypothetical protein CISG_09117 [Coccidioides immitis RMSCC 3703]TPX20427.1 hypothetical protein DIZ76_016315 [Coccidioides immitis]